MRRGLRGGDTFGRARRALREDLLALAFASAVLLGCTQTPVGAETSAHECTGGGDEDGDTLVDCHDPDCWSHAMCRLDSDAGALEQEPSIAPASPPGDETGTLTNPLRPIDRPDATIGNAQLPEGPSVSPVEDAGTVAMPMCAEDCPADACHDGVCSVPASELGSFIIRSLTVEVPRGPDTLNCFDSPMECGAVMIPLLCACAPDLQVVVQVADASAPEARKVGATMAGSHADSHAFRGLSMRLDLREADEIVFTVTDLDEGVPAGQVLRCSVIATEAALATGTLECKQSFPQLNELLQDFGVVAEIEPAEAELPDAATP